MSAYSQLGLGGKVWNKKMNIHQRSPDAESPQLRRVYTAAALHASATDALSPRVLRNQRICGKLSGGKLPLKVVEGREGQPCFVFTHRRLSSLLCCVFRPVGALVLDVFTHHTSSK